MKKFLFISILVMSSTFFINNAIAGWMNDHCTQKCRHDQSVMDWCYKPVAKGQSQPVEKDLTGESYYEGFLKAKCCCNCGGYGHCGRQTNW